MECTRKYGENTTSHTTQQKQISTTLPHTRHYNKLYIGIGT